MILKIANTGIIHEASVVLNGLTVIAGENDTGKSTVGKLMFSIVKAVSRYEQDLQGKIEDSLVLWEMVIRSNDFVWNNETRKAARSVEKRYIILKHCNNIDEYDNALNA